MSGGGRLAPYLSSLALATRPSSPSSRARFAIRALRHARALTRSPRSGRGVLGAAGWLSCSARAVGDEEPVPLSPRGAQTATDWQLFDAQNAKVFDAALGLAPAQYSLALDAKQAERHWQFWDFCAPRPRGAAVSAETWHRVRALVEGHCCACRSGTEAPASWPIAPDAPLRVADSARLVPVHPQARDDSWRLAAGAAPERRVPCAPGASVRDAGGTCEACAQGSYSTAQGCRACAGAGETTAGAYAIDASACVCAAGLFRAPDGACTACPRGRRARRVCPRGRHRGRVKEAACMLAAHSDCHAERARHVCTCAGEAVLCACAPPSSHSPSLTKAG